MGALMSVPPKASEPAWPIPPEGGWTADDLDRLPNLPPHTELIDGSLVFVSPQTLFHSRAVDFLNWQLQSLAPSQYEVIREFTIDIDRQNRPEPDVIVVWGDVVDDPEQTRYPAEAVILAIEVVSAESVSRDRETKPLKYARAGIGHYWRVENDKGPRRRPRLRAGAHHRRLHQRRHLPRAHEGERAFPDGSGPDRDQGTS
ncbi:Uma2 family endonuclease [Streptomyces flaveolus]|uniref:Uma2 family endonuclease n=1 Tax=Streptomyces flaveolus TaxID=67297 RepID=UPI00341A468F